ncbi:MAG TPA: histidine kinase [Gemmatimonadaceae bacterium]|nr:histidine kinase [Gemmatimonadaceae bacterium]
MQRPAIRPHVPLRGAEVLLIVAFWTFLALLTAANAVLDPRPRAVDPPFAWRSVGYAFFQYYLWALLTPLIFWLASRYTLERPDRMKRLLLFLVLGTAIAIGMEALLTWSRFELFFDRPQRGPFGPMRGGRGGGPFFGVRRLFWLDDLMVFIAIVAAGIARDYFWRYRARQEEGVRLEAQAADLQAQLARAQLAALRSQLDPHFLFNTLHAVSSLVERDPRGVRRMIARLSELLRSTLAVAQEPETTLEQELEFLRRYIEIMEIRFQGRLQVEMRIAPEALDALVPTLMLQPLVENAVKHGVSKVEGVGRIAISAEREGDRVRLEIRDNGPGPQREPDTAAEGVGLRNTRARLERLYGEAQDLSLAAAPDGGAIVTVTLPYHTPDDLRAAARTQPDEP